MVFHCIIIVFVYIFTFGLCALVVIIQHILFTHTQEFLYFCTVAFVVGLVDVKQYVYKGMMLNSTFETDFHYGVTKVSTLVVMAVKIAMYFYC